MSPAARSLFIFGVYMTGPGLTLLLVPNQILPVFGFPPSDEVWVHMVGMLVTCVALYYIVAARADFAPFIRFTVYIRASVIVFFGAFVLVGLAPPPLVLMGVIDLVAATWTQVLLLRAEPAHGGVHG